MTTATASGIQIATPRAVIDYLDTCQDTDEMRLVFHFLLARNPYAAYEPSFEQVACDFDCWLRQRPRPRKRAKR